MNTIDFRDSFFNEIKKKFGIIGNSQKVIIAIEKILQAAPTELNVLITGETGTGKEVFAKAIHGLSNRKNGPFVSVNCAAIPENLLEAELFGNEKGAYTGAIEQRYGFFETANNGTIFLDEIGEMSINTQVKLLRVLESGEFSRLGSSAIHKINTRIIAATNRNLEFEVQKGNFRQDLFFRLNSIHIQLPSLKEHPDDIPFLVDYFANNTTKKLNIEYKGFDQDAITILKSLPWPGNVRELKNMIETIITLEKGNFITTRILSKYIPPALPAFESKDTEPRFSLVSLKAPDESLNNDSALIFKTLLELKSDLNFLKQNMNELVLQIHKIKDSTDNLSFQKYEDFSFDSNSDDNFNLIENEKKLILSALKKFNGNRRLVADALGISQRTLYRKLQDYDIN